MGKAPDKCPNCGFPIRSDLNKVLSVECPECGTQVNPELDTCPNCGYSVRRKNVKETFGKTGKWIKDRISRKKLIGLCVVIFIALLLIFLMLNKDHTSKFDFVDYLGTDYVDLPKNVIVEEIMEDYYEAEQKSSVYLCGIKGKVSYFYDMNDLIHIPGIVYSVYWGKEKWEPTDKEIEKIRKKLNDIYGTYDSSGKIDSSDRDYYDEGEVSTEYYWYNREGIDITLSVHEYGNERGLTVSWEESEKWH